MKLNRAWFALVLILAIVLGVAAIVMAFGSALPMSDDQTALKTSAQEGVAALIAWVLTTVLLVLLATWSWRSFKRLGRRS